MVLSQHRILVLHILIQVAVGWHALHPRRDVAGWNEDAIIIIIIIIIIIN